MLDSDLAELYKVETRMLNQAVKRNSKRFPIEFMFQLNKEEYKKISDSFLISQIVTSKGNRGGTRKLPFVFTEQGVSMLAGILKSDIAIKISIKIMNAFVEMRKFISHNAVLFQRLEKVEMKQLEDDHKFEQIFTALEDKSRKPKQGIFFDGQIFDAYLFVSDLIKNAKKQITLIDNYIDETVLILFSKNQKVKVTIYTKNITEQFKLDLEKYNSQYNPIEVKKFVLSHDRFLIIDKKQVYHFGASLKDLGKKWFAFSKLDMKSIEILEKLE